MRTSRRLKARLILSAALIGPALAVTGCSAIEAGEVTAKELEPLHTWVQNSCTSYDSKGICRSWVPIVHTEPDRWRLDLSQGAQTGWVHVTEEQFEVCGVGESYPECADDPEATS